MNQLPIVKSDFHKILQERSAGEYLQIRGRNFRYILFK